MQLPPPPPLSPTKMDEVKTKINDDGRTKNWDPSPTGRPSSSYSTDTGRRRIWKLLTTESDKRLANKKGIRAREER